MIDRDYLTKPDNEFACLNKTVVLLPGSFKPPHKGHWEMITDTINFADEIHIFISNTSEKYILQRILTKTKFSKFLTLFNHFICDDLNIIGLINDIKNTVLIIPYNELKIKIENLIELTSIKYPEFSQKLNNLYQELNKDLFKSIRYTSNGKCIEPEISEEIFKIFIKDYHFENKVFTHICNNPMSIMSAIGFANHQCKNCTIYIGSATNDEINKRDSGWIGTVEACKHNPTNKILRLPVATKIQAARDIRKNINNLTKDMFPPLISNDSFQKIKYLLTDEINNTIIEQKRISKFNLLYEQIMKELINESGIAIKNIQPVKLENIGPTIQKLYTEILAPLGIKFNAITYLGSTGKKAESGDLDIGLDLATALSDSQSKDKFELANKIEIKCLEYGYQFGNALNSQFKTIHIGIPIVNQNGIAQVDIMMTQNLEYAKFRFHSPSPTESKYKGSIRSIMLKAIFDVCSKEIDKNANIEDQIEYIDKDGNKIKGIQYSQLSFDIDGLIKTIKTYRGKRGGLTNTARVLSKEFLDIRDTQKILDLLFNGLYTISDFNSFESIWNNVLFDKNFPYKNEINMIIKKFIEIINRDNSWQLEQNKLAYPTEIIEYASTHGIEL